MKTILAAAMVVLALCLVPLLYPDEPLPTGPRTLIVVGGGAAGMSAALEASRTDPSLHILLFDKGD